MHVVKHGIGEHAISVGLFPATDMWVYHLMLLQFSVLAPRRHPFDYIYLCITTMYYNSGLLSIVIMIICTVNNHIKIEQNK
jgi:hypothetical protein